MKKYGEFLSVSTNAFYFVLDTILNVKMGENRYTETGMNQKRRWLS